jgi:hypothetical protein
MPRTTGFAPRGFHSVSKILTKLIAPARDCLEGHNAAALKNQFLNVAQAQFKAQLSAPRTTDDLGWKAVTVIDRFGFLHPARLSDQAVNLTIPHFPLVIFA